MPQIHFTLKCASGIKDEDTVSNNDLYGVITYGGQKTKTEIAQDGIFQGFKYNWNATFVFDATSDDDIEVRLYDQDVGFDDYIGQVRFNIASAKASGSAELEEPVVTKSREAHGKCLASVRYEP